MQSLQAATDDSKRCQAKKRVHTPNLHVLFAPCSNSCSCCHTPHLRQLRRKIMPCTRILLPNSPEQSAKSQVYVHYCAAACSRACTPASNPSCSHTIAAQHQSWLQADNMITYTHCTALFSQPSRPARCILVPQVTLLMQAPAAYSLPVSGIGSSVLRRALSCKVLLNVLQVNIADERTCGMYSVAYSCH